MEQTLGFSHFLSQADLLIRGVFVLLLVLSTASWYLILTKSVTNLRARRRAKAFIKRFWDADSLREIGATIGNETVDNPFTDATTHAAVWPETRPIWPTLTQTEDSFS
jgi:biopolymer transport protein ExbB